MEFNPLSTPLEGINLIEASAGTGKTYTIATLMIRLLLENDLNINQILVVTFTEAATTELKDRIRKRLEEMRQVLLIILEKNPVETSQPDAVLLQIAQQCPEPILALEKIKSAIYGFDEAAIFTIHSFCRKTLQEFAFESGALFDVELAGDQSEILEEIAQDFWRQKLYNANPLFLDYIISQKFTLENFISLLNKPSWYTNWDFLTLVPKVHLKPLSFSEEDYQIQFKKVQKIYQQNQLLIHNFFFNAIGTKSLSGKTYRKDWIIKWLNELSVFARSTQITPILPDKFYKFTVNELNKNAKNNQTFNHSFFVEAQTLFDQATLLLGNYQQQILQLKHQLLSYANTELKKRQKKQHIQSFDDLLIDLHEALKEDNKERDKLINVINYKYQAALIDEFQDTDNLQYKIFYQLFEQKCLFFIGDPKQAIYGFRGADIFSYIEASKQAREQIYTLSTNYRSTPSLIQATNTVFQNHLNPFHLEAIHFSNAQPAEKVSSAFQPALHIHFLERHQQQENINKAFGKKKIADFIANKVVTILNEKDFTAGDIAILVRKNKEAHLLQRTLQNYKIPAVLYSHENIFTSDEAIAMKYLLSALLETTNETAIKTALITDFFELNVEHIFLLSQDEHQWSIYLEYFQDHAEIWKNKGFMPMFRHLLFSNNPFFAHHIKLISHLLSFPNGERKLTNFLHLAEILHTTEKQEHFGMKELHKWLVEKINYLDNEEEHELRLESDEKAVKLVTIHKSKGLQYPIVFLPFIWDGHLQIKNSAEEFIFHDPEQNNKLILALDSNNIDKNQAVIEEKAENARLLYVGLTRAQFACHTVFGVFKDVENAAWTHLLFKGQQNLSKQSDQNLLNELEDVVQKSQQTIQTSTITFDKRTVAFQNNENNTEKLEVREIKRKLKNNWHIHSFTALSGQMQAAEDQIDNRTQRLDTELNQQVIIEETDEMISEMGDIFDLPAGAKIGNLLHEILEDLDFQSVDSNLIQMKMGFHRFDEKYQITIEKLLNNVLNSRLKEDFCLADISLSQRLNELEFYFPVDLINANKLNTLLIPYWEQRWGLSFKKLFFYDWQGFMRGFVDLIFEHNGQYFLVDYKSNRLGKNLKDYAPEQLPQAMKEHHYFLQYHIYSVALHCYLEQRLQDYDYEKHFGGVFYLFLRGMHPDYPQNGVFYDKPDASFIKQLTALFHSKIA
jgi:exodeoxyribonuclease V beta subunit